MKFILIQKTSYEAGFGNLSICVEGHHLQRSFGPYGSKPWEYLGSCDGSCHQEVPEEQIADITCAISEKNASTPSR